MLHKLKDRIESYQRSTDFQLLPRLPIITCVNGRSFLKLTSLLDKPYSEKFAKVMFSTMFKLCSEIEGTLFGYCFNDKIVIVSRNDQSIETTPWFDNKIQKICSATSAIATLHFNENCEELELLGGRGLLLSKVFVVPNLVEAINTIVCKQQQNFYLSIQLACFYELLKKYNETTIKEMLLGLSIDEKHDLLSQECSINFEEYPSVFRRGAACYKVPKVINEVMKNKWCLNTNLPIFTQDQSFLGNIFRNGADIFREEHLFVGK